MATLTVGMAMTSMMITSCSKADNPVEELDGAPSSGYYSIPEDMLDLSKVVEANPRTLLLKDGAFVTGRLSVVYDIVVAKGASITLYAITGPGPGDSIFFRQVLKNNKILLSFLRLSIKMGILSINIHESLKMTKLAIW